MGRRALIVVDVQRAVVDELDPAYDGAGLLQRLSGLIQSARAAGAPVVYIQHDGGAGDSLEHGSAGWEIHPAVAPLPGELVI
jgi:nicotinamidase-related amidase